MLQLAKVAIACSGYRVGGFGHHYTTFEALELAIGPSATKLVAYFDACRLKRNHVDYDYADITSDTEAKELLSKPEEFHKAVESWFRRRHPEYVRPQ